MSKVLRLAPNLTLPIDAVTQTIAILAKRRVGKSYTARRFAEQLFKAGLQVVIVDPKGDHWGIRSAADGKSPGLPIVILGGEHGDVPLEVGSGEIIAKLVAEERVSALLDLSFFRKHEVATFMTAFLENLYRLKAREAFRTPLMLEIDEADAIAPQKPQPNEARMLGAIEDVVRRGGQRGMGCILITQRSAVLNKNVLTQAEMIVALRTIAPQDLAAIDAWVEVHGTEEEREKLMSSLPSLPVGDAWFWAPGWPTAEGIFQRVHVSAIETFDSGASPKAGEKRVEPKNLADVDLGALTKQMASTIESAKANDPKALKTKIAQLEADLRKAGKQNGHVAPAKAVVDQSAIERAVKTALAAERKRWQPTMTRIERDLGNAYTAARKLADSLQATLAPLSDAIHSESNPVAIPPLEHLYVGQTSQAPSHRPLPPRASVEARPIEGISRPQARMLQALASFESLGIPDMARSHVAVFSDQSPRSSGADKNFSTLRSAGLIENLSDSRVRLTDAGRAAAGTVESPASLEQLHQAWCAKVSGPQRLMLEHLISRYPKPLERERLAEASNQSPLSSGWDKNLSTLRSLGLIDYPDKDHVVATDLLFPEGLT